MTLRVSLLAWHCYGRIPWQHMSYAEEEQKVEGPEVSTPGGKEFRDLVTSAAYSVTSNMLCESISQF